MDLGYVYKYRNEAEDLWKLDLKILNLFTSILSKLDVRNEIKDILENLAEETKEIVELGVLYKGKVLFLDVIKKHDNLINVPGIGAIVDINCCVAGIVLAAYLDEEQLNSIISKIDFIQYTEYTLKNETQIRTELKKVKEKEYAMDDQWYAIGHRCIGAPIFDYNGKVVASVNIAGHISSITDNRIDELSKIVKKSAKEASKRLGYIN
jgi:DNA-binding IclR family transcriptional regulator